MALVNHSRWLTQNSELSFCSQGQLLSIGIQERCSKHGRGEPIFGIRDKCKVQSDEQHADQRASQQGGLRKGVYRGIGNNGRIGDHQANNSATFREEQIYNLPEVATILPAELLPSLSKSSFLVFSKGSNEREALVVLGEVRGSGATCWRAPEPKDQSDLVSLCLETLGAARIASDVREEYMIVA